MSITENNISDEPELVEVDENIVVKENIAPENPKKVEDESDGESEIKVENESGGSDESDDEYESEEEEEMYQTLVKEPQNDMFILCIDGKPQYCVKTSKEAEKCLWHLAKCLNKFNPNYTTYFSRINKHTMYLERRYRWFVVSYDEIVHKITYKRVKGVKLVDVQETGDVKETGEEKEKNE